MKRLIVCIDGTTNATEVGPGECAPTNVLLFARALAMRDAAQAPQILFYTRGVATDISAGKVGRVWAALRGVGLSQLVQDAYHFLTNNFEKTDQVYLLGFSRGAAAVRSLSGLTELFGILPKSTMHLFKDAWHYYNNTHPEQRDPQTLNNAVLRAIAECGEKLRRAHLKECASDSKEVSPLEKYPHAPQSTVAARDTGDSPRDGVKDTDDKGTSPRKGVEDTTYVAMPLHFVGVWDTVYRANVEKFHESRLAWNVGAAYQALAIHEVRKQFQPVFWDRKCPHQSVAQTWFPGAHSDVGGGTNAVTLSSVSLAWMVGHAELHGLRFDPPDPPQRTQLSRSKVIRPDSRRSVSVSRREGTDLPAFLYGMPKIRAIEGLHSTTAVDCPRFRHRSVAERLATFERYSGRYWRDEEIFRRADDASLSLSVEPAEACAQAVSDALKAVAEAEEHIVFGLNNVDKDLEAGKKANVAALAAIERGKAACASTAAAVQLLKAIGPMVCTEKATQLLEIAKKAVEDAANTRGPLQLEICLWVFRNGLNYDLPTRTIKFRREFRNSK
jgi:hypothetical protein